MIQNDSTLQNRLIKIKFPYLYKNLIENVLRNRIQHITRPNDIPQSAKKSSSKACLSFSHVFGKILTYFMCFVIGMHIFPSIMAGCVFVVRWRVLRLLLKI